MRECDLNDNDPLEVYLRTLMVDSSPVTNATRSVSLSRDHRTDSISDVTRRRSENINHAEIDTENDKMRETDVSKQMD